MGSNRSIPKISFQTRTGNSVNSQSAAIRTACEETGFFVITGHGISMAVMEACHDAAIQFFDRSIVEKKRVQQTTRGSPYGYSPMAKEALARSRGDDTPPDLKESFSIGPPTPRLQPLDPDEAIFAATPNRWPDAPANFRTAFEAYYRAMNNVADILMRRFAVALDLPEEYFLPFIRHPISALRANHYPPLASAPSAGQLRAGAHSDYGTLTILMQSSGSDGLEIQNRNGDWIPVTGEAPDLIVNIGDLMARWTNNRWVSSVHRVVVPDDAYSRQQRRMSLAYFHQPDWNAEIRCIPSCLPDKEQPIYPPIRSGRYLMEKFHSTVL
jgi:isopenicillin N synthase-like dioxygenase